MKFLKKINNFAFQIAKFENKQNMQTPFQSTVLLIEVNNLLLLQ